MFTFVGNESDGMPQKRNHTQRACETCRKRKKRCRHTEIEANSSMTSQDRSPRRRELQVPANVNDVSITDSRLPSVLTRSEPLDVTERSSVLSHQNSDRPSDPGPYRGSFHEDGSPHFVGDLNPEGIFLAATSPTSPNGGAPIDGVGVWLSNRAADMARHSRIPYDSTDPFKSKLLLPYIEDQCMRLLPSKQDLDALSKIYFEEIDPIFPVIDQATYHSLLEASPAKVVIMQAVCLAASTSTSAKGLLKLPTTTSSSRKDFAEQLSFALRMSLTLGHITDTLVSIQVLALLSLFTQLSNDRHLSAELSARAVSWTQTAGLHLQAHPDRTDHNYLSRLFCCVWALDRLNAAFHGRPVMIHERDFGFDLETCLGRQEGCFQLFLRTVLLLDKVIDLYRPTTNAAGLSWEDNFPAFEDLLYNSGAIRVPSNLLATIETLYHAVAMLSYRSQTLQECPRNSASYLRQNLSAVRVTSIVGQEFHGHLSMLPLIPYAVSLSLRVSYRDLRLSKAPIFRTRARGQLLANCALLKELGEMYCSATAMADLAEQIIREMDKVSSQIMVAHSREPGQESGSTNHPAGQFNALNTPEAQSRASESGPPSENGLSNPAVGNGTSEEQNLQTTANFHYDPDSFDQFQFSNMPDFDIFEHFDPEFNLEAMDAVLINNINLSFPMQLEDFTGRGSTSGRLDTLT